MMHSLRWVAVGIVAVSAVTTLTLRAVPQQAPPSALAAEVTFTKTSRPSSSAAARPATAPKASRRCRSRPMRRCGRGPAPSSSAPASGPRAGVMPPWYVEKNIGIQQFKNDPSLSDEEIAKIARWADTGAPRGNPADMPPARVWNEPPSGRSASPTSWCAPRTPRQVHRARLVGEIPRVPTGLTEDRYVAALEIKEVNDVPPRHRP